MVITMAEKFRNTNLDTSLLTFLLSLLNRVRIFFICVLRAAIWSGVREIIQVYEAHLGQ